eukprot:TRINITY_DN16277_c0_g1_i1.p1 TRINITY_DN16277_c0_g1~~TRINITY_DN16277_c0_g1_i1.p1  ORF type:complete len:822 (+),score=143.60 TRINITY_DN16277_c0_g1_i1:52-2466(+)
MPLRHLRCGAEDHFAGAAAGTVFRRAAVANKARKQRHRQQRKLAVEEDAACDSPSLLPSPRSAATTTPRRARKAVAQLQYVSPLRVPPCIGSAPVPLHRRASAEALHRTDSVEWAATADADDEQIHSHFAALIAREQRAFARPRGSASHLARLKAPLQQRRPESAGATWPQPARTSVAQRHTQSPLKPPPPNRVWMAAEGLSSWVVARRCFEIENAETAAREVLLSREGATRRVGAVEGCQRLAMLQEAGGRQQIERLWFAEFAGGRCLRVQRSVAYGEAAAASNELARVRSVWVVLRRFAAEQRHTKQELERGRQRIAASGVPSSKAYRRRQFTLEEELQREALAAGWSGGWASIVKAQLTPIPPQSRPGAAKQRRKPPQEADTWRKVGAAEDAVGRSVTTAEEDAFYARTVQRLLGRSFVAWRNRFHKCRRAAAQTLRVRKMERLLRLSEARLRAPRFSVWRKWTFRVASRARHTQVLASRSAGRHRSFRLAVWQSNAALRSAARPGIAAVVAAVAARWAVVIPRIANRAADRLRRMRYNALRLCVLRSRRLERHRQDIPSLVKRSYQAHRKLRWKTLVHIAYRSPFRQNRRLQAETLAHDAARGLLFRYWWPLRDFGEATRTEAARADKVLALQQMSSARHRRLRWECLGKYRSRRWARRRAMLRCTLMAERLRRELCLRYWMQLLSGAHRSRRVRDAEQLLRVNAARHRSVTMRTLWLHCHRRRYLRAQGITATELYLERQDMLLRRYWSKMRGPAVRAVHRRGQVPTVLAAAARLARQLQRRCLRQWVRWCAERLLLAE